MTKDERTHYVIGVDLGKLHDHTAIVVDRYSRPEGEHEHQVGHVEQISLGTSYRAVVDHVVELAAKFEEHDVVVGIDASGVGEPILEQLISTLPKGRESPRVVPVQYVGGSKVTKDGQRYRVPKQTLVDTAVVAFENQHLEVSAKLEHAPILVSELKTFTVTYSDAGNRQFANHRSGNEGTHDDMVNALCVAIWVAENAIPPRSSLGGYATSHLPGSGARPIQMPMRGIPTRGSRS